MLALSHRSLLNKTFIADGIFSLVVGTILIADAGPLAALVGPALSPTAIVALGMGLLLWGAFHVISARNGGPTALAARISIAGDILWEIASLVILALAYASLTATGIGLIIVAMIGVADFLFLKLRGAFQAGMRQAA
ncbi:hypothetical protein [Sinorhizobium americanum]|uniref:Uncharacterized protein n=1 Tax=Sinorhizobium americanum TaxID=194963 RepID=A0A1L3LHX6_9HYPH|nr:hypothetical protein [Sinorhizobium americanum]APG83085.1 hypothetical protein SAMCCGM7_Ch0293 [Sinorhizobium americanum CCGM7]APG89623.1 hypothetical protein SAMCFNEI73_Ch0291 [Sinorhizobium americanum]OAP36056.1 hypothetical protein ATC00_29350 [Sinorhizobium americanum]